MSNRVDFGNEGTVLHAVFIHFKVVKQNCLELLSLGLSIYFTSYIYQIKLNPEVLTFTAHQVC